MSLLDKENEPLADQAALRRHIEQALTVEPPRGLELDLSHQLVKRLFNPMVIGAQNIPDQPCLFVGNHSLFALDAAVITPIFLKELHRFTRGMGDKFLFSNRRIADFLVSKGLVMGHPEVCTALMQAKQDLLVFPGGAYESVKPVTKFYDLQWKERYGFVKLAAMHGYTIMPFGLVIESQDLPNSVLGRVLTRLGVLHDGIRFDILPPVPLGSLGTLFPKPQRCYLGFGKPINLSRYKGKTLSKRTLYRVRAQVAEQIEMQLAELLSVREKHKGDDSMLRRLLTA
jgi:1-acyl-sn-glycerol-3-phosphate acyltransferase